MRVMNEQDAEALALLMLDSYRGSVDDEGETLEEARHAIAQLFRGDFGTLDPELCLVVDDGTMLAAATIVTRDRVAPPPLRSGEAFLAFSMTAPLWKRRGLGRAGLERVVEMLRARGEPRLHLVVTRTNEPATRLYRSMGFVDGPQGG